MKIQNIQFTHNNKKNLPAGIKPTHRFQSPVQDSLKTAGAWFGFGVGLDFVCRKITFFKSPVKNSLFVNSTLAAIAGTCTYIKNKTKFN